MADIGSDFLVVGAGIAGASAAYALAQLGAVILLEQEDRPGRHATGRSAALFSGTYGNAAVRALSRASRAFLHSPPLDFCEGPILRPRGALYVAAEVDRSALIAMLAEEASGAFELMNGEVARARVPILRPEAAVVALYEAGAMDIDVDLLHQGYLRGLRLRGGRLAVNAPVAALRRERGRWIAETAQGRFSAPVLINAAGAWADEVGRLAGAAALGLQPRRRTAAIVSIPDIDAAAWPIVIDAGEQFYFKPDAGQLLISPGDETPSPPCDAQPDDIDVAIAADRIERATRLAIRRISHRWAGLRTFAPDRTPVCGFDEQAEGFFWLAGQGGYGVQTAPAMAALTAQLAAGDAAWDGDLAARVSPARLGVASPQT